MATQPLKLSSPSVLEFVIYAKPEPQGSKNAYYIPKLNRSVIVDTNDKKLKPYRQQVTRTVMADVPDRPWAGKHIPVRLELTFCLHKPKSAHKSRVYPVVTPDADKMARSTCDSLTGILYADDAQIVELIVKKVYAIDECVRIRAEIL